MDAEATGPPPPDPAIALNTRASAIAQIAILGVWGGAGDGVNRVPCQRGGRLAPAEGHSSAVITPP